MRSKGKRMIKELEALVNAVLFMRTRGLREDQERPRRPTKFKVCQVAFSSIRPLRAL